MRQEQVTNEDDNEVIRATRHDDGTIVLEWSPCDGDGYATSFGWVEIARIDPDGTRHYADEVDGNTWTEGRTFAANSVLRLL